MRIFNAGTNFGDCEVTLTGESFNDAYCYVDGLLLAPLFLIELLCVMDLPADQLASKGFTLGLAAAAMGAHDQGMQHRRSVDWLLTVPLLLIELLCVTDLPAN